MRFTRQLVMFLVFFLVVSLLTVSLIQLKPLYSPPAAPPVLPTRGTNTTDENGFTFTITSDQRNFTGQGTYDDVRYYRGALEALSAINPGVFMVSPGDIDPVEHSRWTIDQVFGEDYLWFPVAGNHELPGQGSEATYGANMEALRAYNLDPNGVDVPPDIVNLGPSGCPETTYSFDYANVHFVVLNEYCDQGGDTATSGDIPDHLYQWLKDDLEATQQAFIMVFGHEPAYVQEDADNGRLRHQYDSLDQNPETRDRFWELLVKQNVLAYIVGHTHNYSAVLIDGVWQIDAGHARGAGDTGAPSTILLVHVGEESVSMQVFRETHDGVYDYDDIVHEEVLAGK